MKRYIMGAILGAIALFGAQVAMATWYKPWHENCGEPFGEQRWTIEVIHWTPHVVWTLCASVPTFNQNSNNPFSTY